MAEIHIVFDGPPSHEAGRFVEVETPDGRSVRVGRWQQHEHEGWWSLVLDVVDDSIETNTPERGVTVDH